MSHHIGVLQTKKQKTKPVVVYSTDRKSGIGHYQCDELQDYVDRGYDVLYEETNLTMFHGVDQPFKNTSGKFNQGCWKKSSTCLKRIKRTEKYKGKVFEVVYSHFPAFEKGKRKY